MIGYDIDSVLCTTARNKALDNGVSHLGINTYNLTLYIVIITTVVNSNVNEVNNDDDIFDLVCRELRLKQKTATIANIKQTISTKSSTCS